MASQITTQHNLQSGIEVASTDPKIKSRDAGARDYVISGTHTTDSALTAGSHTLTLFKLPAGAKVNSLELIVPAGVGTSSAKIGISSDDDRYGSAVDLSSAGRKQFILTAANAEYVTTQEESVILAPVTTNFATAIAFAWVCKYTVH